MKKIFLTFSLIVCTFVSIMAQESLDFKKEKTRDRSVYAEFFGPSNMIGVAYDARFVGNDHFGYRVGLGYSYGMTDLIGFYNSKSHAYTVPAEVNCLIGKGRSRLEVGVGINLGYYYSHWHILDQEDSDSTLGYFCYCNIGYRLTTKRGFQLRIGVTPTFNFGGEHAVEHDPKLYPYLSLGYAF